MNFRKLPPLVLAVFLQFAPVVKLFQANPLTMASSPLAIVLRWAAGVVAAVGAYHTVTGASAAIVGMQKLTNSPTGPKPAGLVTASAVEPAGGSFFYRIVVTNPGTDHAQDFWNVVPLAPGITVNTNLGGNGWITNTPGQVTVAGVYPVTLVAGNANFGQVTFAATITITDGNSSAPVITNQPVNTTVLVGSNVTFTVGASGTPPPSYQWFKLSSPINGATGATLTITNAQGVGAWNYFVQVSNSRGTNVSQTAVLTVVDRPLLSVTSPQPDRVTLSFTSQPTVGYALQYAPAIPPVTWSTLTNYPASPTSIDRTVVETTTNGATRFYRLNLAFP